MFFPLLFIFIFVLVVSLYYFSSMCTNEDGHNWDKNYTHNGKNIRIDFFECKYCGRQVREMWKMKKI